MHALLATGRTDLQVLSRDRPVLAVGILVPLALVAIMTLFFGAAGQPDAAPLALVRSDGHPLAVDLEETFANVRSQLSPWWKLLPDPPDAAWRAWEDGRIPAVVEIPADFSHRLQTTGSASIIAWLNNYNSDLDQNYRYRLGHTLLVYEAAFPDNRGVRVDNLDALPRDVPWTTYMAGGILAYAAMAAGLVYGGIASVRDIERGTLRVIALSPASRAMVGLGRALGATAATMGPVTVAGLAAWAVWGVRPDRMAVGLALTGILALLALAFASLGVALGAAVRRQRLLMLPVGLVALPLWFLSGGIGPVGLLPAWMQAVATWLPTTYAFRATLRLLLAARTDGLAGDLLVLSVTALLGLVAAALATARTRA